MLGMTQGMFYAYLKSSLLVICIFKSICNFYGLQQRGNYGKLFRFYFKILVCCKNMALDGKIRRFSSWGDCFCESEEHADILKISKNSVWFLRHLSHNDIGKE